MHSPPPTPAQSRVLAHHKEAASAADHQDSSHTAQQAAAIALANGARHGRKRSTERAGLITPRETPLKRSPRDNMPHVDAHAAKILFPMIEEDVESRAKFKVFEDAREPDMFRDDEANPFMQPAKSKASRGSMRPRIARRSSSEDRDEALLAHDPFATPSGTRPPHDPLHIPPHPLQVDGGLAMDRTDGLYYVFRGKRIFKPFESEADKLNYDSGPAPKLLFQAEIQEKQRRDGLLHDHEDDTEMN